MIRMLNKRTFNLILLSIGWWIISSLGQILISFSYQGSLQPFISYLTAFTIFLPQGLSYLSSFLLQKIGINSDWVLIGSIIEPLIFSFIIIFVFQDWIIKKFRFFN